MAVLAVKSMLSLSLALFALAGLFSMLGALGRESRWFRPGTLMLIHRINGVVYAFVFLVIGYLCLKYLRSAKYELNARITMHATIALALFSILCLKVLFTNVYRKFYGMLNALGITMAVGTIVLVGISGGYYLLLWGVGQAQDGTEKVAAVSKDISTGPESITRGKDLYDSKCYLCHDPFSTRTITGPGHKGILKRGLLPLSGRAATAHNIERQIREPYRDMPSFDYLSKQQVSDIIAYMATL